MLEEIKYSLFDFDDYNLNRNFEQSDNYVKYVYKNVIVFGTEENISVYYDVEDMRTTKKLQFINKYNTLKKFNNTYAAISYTKYLSNVTTDIRYEMYHYFMYQLKESEIEYKTLLFNPVNNYTIEDMMLRCDISDLSIKGRKVKYNFIIILKKDGKCNLSFYPENPVWDEGKDCPETDVDKIIEYILNLNIDNYDDIPLIES
ncbi:hypothetical protein [Chryseobacterium paridis]|uniref:Uncharacterized protein n=1 Tax=Chryseobacterium paridis TaxID=2800328 RepID=A0ABS1FYX6_9FLAO|nr:hypothetical protein [Chryseobacterium paridis]MBK1897379.1 hypothetical protein [Chryseobacterium paridis]